MLLTSDAFQQPAAVEQHGRPRSTKGIPTIEPTTPPSFLGSAFAVMSY